MKIRSKIHPSSYIKNVLACTISVFCNRGWFFPFYTFYRFPFLPVKMPEIFFIAHCYIVQRDIKRIFVSLFRAIYDPPPPPLQTPPRKILRVSAAAATAKSIMAYLEGLPGDTSLSFSLSFWRRFCNCKVFFWSPSWQARKIPFSSEEY